MIGEMELREAHEYVRKHPSLSALDCECEVTSCSKLLPL